MFKFELGSEVRDKMLKVGGRSGQITARADYLSGLRRYCIEYVTTVGEHKELWLDEERLEAVE